MTKKEQTTLTEDFKETETLFPSSEKSIQEAIYFNEKEEPEEGEAGIFS